MSHRVEICAAEEREQQELNREDVEGYGGVARGNRNPLEVFEFETRDSEWEDLLAEARFLLRQEAEDPEVGEGEGAPGYETGERLAAVDESARERKIYRGRTVAMLRRYMRYSMETGRLPSVLGREFFRAKVTSYTVVTFEDRVIFVHDMEKCLSKLDEFSQQLIARHILQEHDQAATGKLLNCTERTVRNWVPIALDLLSEILLDTGLLERRK